MFSEFKTIIFNDYINFTGSFYLSLVNYPPIVSYVDYFQVFAIKNNPRINSFVHKVFLLLLNLVDNFKVTYNFWSLIFISLLY